MGPQFTCIVFYRAIHSVLKNSAVQTTTTTTTITMATTMPTNAKLCQVKYHIQPDQINMAVFFWYLVKSDSSAR